MSNKLTRLTTAQLAEMIGMKPESIRVRLCKHGSLYGITPNKLHNGRLLWPADSVDRMINKGGAA